MDPFWGSLVSGGAQLGGSLLGGLFGSGGQSATNAQSLSMFNQQMAFAQAQQEKAQQFNHDEAELSRNWQADMSNSAYQRSMRDMRLAGLNPILAANLGGASSPGGASASITGASAPGAPSLGSPGDAMARGVTSAGEAAGRAMATKAVLTQAEKDASQVKLNQASEKYTDSNTTLNKTLDAKAQQDSATSAEQMRVAIENQKNIRADTANKNLESIIKMHEGTTAFEKSRLAKFEADQSGKWGPGTWGALSGTIEKGWKSFKEDWITPYRWGSSSGDPNNQPGTHQQRGVTVHATHPSDGEGLRIDMGR